MTVPETIQFAVQVVFQDDSDDEQPYFAFPPDSCTVDEKRAGDLLWYEINNGSGVTWQVDEMGIPIEGFDEPGASIPAPGCTITLRIENSGREDIPDGDYPLHVVVQGFKSEKISMTLQAARGEGALRGISHARAREPSDPEKKVRVKNDSREN